MTVDEKIEVLKFCSAVFNTIFLILGFSIFGCAVWLLWDKGNFLAILNSDEVKTLAGGLFIIGLVVVFVSVLGCVGTHVENRFFLLLYMGFLIVLVLGQVFVSVVLVVNRGKIEESLEETVDHIIVKYGGSTELSTQEKLLDNVQHYGKCCGMTGPSDWLMNPFVKNMSLTDLVVLPCSCFSASKCPVIPGHNTRIFGTGNNTNHTFEEGCKEKIGAWLDENTLTIVAMDLSLMFIQVVQFVLSVYLYRSVGKKAELRKSRRLIDTEPQQDPDLANPQQDDPDQDNGYGTQNQGYIEEVQGYIDENQGYMEHDNGYIDENQGYMDHNNGYIEYGLGHPEQHHDYEGYNHVYPEQNFDYPQPNQDVYETHY